MQEIVIEALLKGVLVPLVVAFMAAGVIRFGLNGRFGKNLAAAAIAVGVLTGAAALNGWPSLPPIAASQKTVYLVLFGAVLGALMDLLARPAFLRRASILIWPPVIVGWIGWRQLTSLDPAALLGLALIAIAGMAIFRLLYDDGGSGGAAAAPGPAAPVAPVALIAASIGAAAVAFAGQTSSLSQSYGALAAAAGGYVLWNWPAPRYRFGAAGVLGAGGAFLALTTIMFRFSETNKWALAVVLLVFLCPAIVRMTPVAKSDAWAPVVTGITSAIPVAIAVAIAMAM
jgi:hypothetical protein